MKGDIKAPGRDRMCSTHDRVGKLTLTAQDPMDEEYLAVLSQAIFPMNGRDKDFDRWLLKRLRAHGNRLVKEGKTIAVKAT